MDKWTIKSYAVRRLSWENKVEYWDFFLGTWVTPSDVDYNCITTYSAASCVKNDYPSSEIVEMRVTIKEM